MNIRFLSKVIGGAALGAGVMLFGAPGAVSAGYGEPVGPSLEQANVAVIEDAFGQEAEAVAFGTGDAVALNLAAVIQVNVAIGDDESATLECTYNASLNGEETDLYELSEANNISSMDDAITWLESLNGDDDTECVVDNGNDDDHDKKDHDKKKDDKDDLDKELKNFLE